MENMAWVIKYLWYISFHQQLPINIRYFPLELHVELMLTVHIMQPKLSDGEIYSGAELTFSMGFNITAPYMEFLHLNWYISEWTGEKWPAFPNI